jgi:hypothetical protein
MGMLKRYLELDFTQKLGWLATVTLIVASGVNGLGYYPAGPLMLALGGAIWLWVSVRMRNWPLIVNNAVLLAVGLGTTAWNLL